MSTFTTIAELYTPYRPGAGHPAPVRDGAARRIRRRHGGAPRGLGNARPDPPRDRAAPGAQAEAGVLALGFSLEGRHTRASAIHGSRIHRRYIPDAGGARNAPYIWTTSTRAEGCDPWTLTSAMCSYACSPPPPRAASLVSTAISRTSRSACARSALSPSEPPRSRSPASRSKGWPRIPMR